MRRLFSIYLLTFVLITGCALQNPDHPMKKDYETVKGVPDFIAESKEAGIVPNGQVQVYVKRSVDGDTLAVIYSGKSYRVRLLDIDTPESVKQGVAVQPYAKEASDFTKDLTQGKKVKLVFEKNIKDKYGRLLAHVFLKDGTYLNAVLVRNGYARIEIISPNTILRDYFVDLQQQAIREQAGFWSLPQNERPFVKNEYGEYVPRYWLIEDAS